VNVRWLDMLMLLSIATATWMMVRIDSVVHLTYSDILITLFLAAFLLDRLDRRDLRMHPAAWATAGFMLVFFAVYLCGFFDLSVRQATGYWAKGVLDWMIHALFLVFMVAHLARRGRPLYERTIRWFIGGIVIVAVYGVAQLGAKIAAGINLDNIVVKGITFGLGHPTGINVYGQVGGTSNIYRVNSLTGDPNHLGVMLCVPLLLLLPRYLSDRRGQRRLGLLLVFLLTVQALTLSRSAALGDIVGLLVLSPTIVPRLPRPRTLLLALGVPIAALLLLYASSSFVRTVISSRTNVNGSGVKTHFEFYSLVGPALDPHPLFGMGYNTFAVFYQFLTGKSDYGPHSFWVATLVETGVVGLAVYLAFFAWVMACALAMRHAADPDRRLLADGLVAALAATVAANFFYLTMGFDYFYVVLLLVVAGYALFAPARETVSRTVAAPARAR
jgi:O-antigen ligase